MIKEVRALAGVLCAAGVIAGCSSDATGVVNNRTVAGPTVNVGNGTANTFVVLNGDVPVSMGIQLSDGALQALPDAPREWQLALPAGVSVAPYNHAALDWNPQGHPPAGIYTVPHFDFHFYAMSTADVAKVHFSGSSDPATQVSDKGLIAANYQVIPDTAIDKMGVHAIDVTAPEFHGQPFTATFIYGYYQGRLTFVEPMVTRAYLLKKPNFSKAVPRPAHYSLSGYYPSRYTVRYDARHKLYSVELAELQYEGASLTSLMPAPKGGNP